MTTWHPATKLLLLAAVLAVPYLLLTRPDTPAAVAVRAVQPAEADQASKPGEDPFTATSVVPYALPPLEQFAAVVAAPAAAAGAAALPLAEAKIS